MERYFIFDENDVHFYTFIVGDKVNGETLYQLERSGDEGWCDPGEIVVEAIDTGNGFKIFCHDFDINDMTDDYAAIEYVYLLLDSIHKYDNHLMSKYRMVKDEEFVKEKSPYAKDNEKRS